MNEKYFLRKIVKLVLGLMILILSGQIISCKKFVQIGPPVTQLVAASVFNNSAAATSAQTTIYTQMANNGESFFMSQNSGLLGDELTNYSTGANIQFYTNSMLPGSSSGRWLYWYNYIYEANSILTALQNNNNISRPIEQQLIGESKFIRAFCYFYLTNCYGDVPLAITTDYIKNGSISRTPKLQVYQQIIADLKDAVQSLNINFVDASDTILTTERVRPTKSAAEALLARVYLYTGKYDSAESHASTVINNNLFKLCINLSPLMGSNSVFQKNSTEAILQFSTPLPDVQNTFDGQFYFLKSAPSTGTANSTTISPQLFNSFETGDLRKTNWIGVYKTTTSPASTYNFPYKYQSNNTASPITEYVMVLRLSEQYLIRAEARAQQNNLTGAADDLNVIRSRAGLGKTSANTQADLLAAILHERQVELFTEWGHRWFDLIRTNNINLVMAGPSGVCHAKGGSWLSTAQLYPIPQSDITNDANLTQNSGY